MLQQEGTLVIIWCKHLIFGWETKAQMYKMACLRGLNRFAEKQVGNLKHVLYTQLPNEPIKEMSAQMMESTLTQDSFIKGGRGSLMQTSFKEILLKELL